MDYPAVAKKTDLDQYKLPEKMYLDVFHPDAVVQYELINRTKSERLADIIPIQALCEQLDFIKALTFDETELAYLQGTGVYAADMLPQIDRFRKHRFPDYEIRVVDGQYQIIWNDILAETLTLSAVSELRTYFLMKKHGIKVQDVVNEAVRVLRTKIEDLKKLPRGSVLEFGTRRRALRLLQKLLFEILLEETNGVVNATSNVALLFN